MAGRRDQLAGKLQERYGIAKDVAEKQIAEWQDGARDDWFSPSQHGDTAANNSAAQRNGA